MKVALPLLFLLFGGSVIGQEATPALDAAAEAYRKAATSVDQDLRTALDELAAQRAVIATEKPPLAIESERIAADLREKRRQADLARTTRESADAEFTKTEADLKIWRDEKQYIENLLFEFRKVNEAQQSLARNKINRALLDDPGTDARLDLVEATLSQFQNLAQATTLKGEALGVEGTIVPGTFVEVGPVSWFVSDDKTVAGLTVPNENLVPKVIAGTGTAADIAQAVLGEKVDLPFDPTLGTAVTFNATKTTWWEHIQQGGFWMYPILALGLVSFVTALYKWAQLSRIRSFPASRVQSIVEHLRRGETQKAYDVAAKIHHPARNILEHGIKMAAASESINRENIEEGLYEKYIEAVPRLQKGLLFIAIASAAAPLLGLLGTVTGIMKIFRLINIFGTGDARTLASGISEALTATEYGLVVAIPSLILHALIARSVHRIKDTMEMTSLAFLNGLDTEESPPAKTPESRRVEESGADNRDTLPPRETSPRPA